MNPWYNRLPSTSLIGLLFLCLAWELWLAPLRPGGSMLALKALPLLFSLPFVVVGMVVSALFSFLRALLFLPARLLGSGR